MTKEGAGGDGRSTGAEVSRGSPAMSSTPVTLSVRYEGQNLQPQIPVYYPGAAYVYPGYGLYSGYDGVVG